MKMLSEIVEKTPRPKRRCGKPPKGSTPVEYTSKQKIDKAIRAHFKRPTQENTRSMGGSYLRICLMPDRLPEDSLETPSGLPEDSLQ